MQDFVVSTSASPDDLRDRFFEYGILVFPDYLSGSSVSVLSRTVQDHFMPILNDPERLRDRSTSKINFDVDVVPWDPLADGDAGFTELANEERLARLTESVLGEGFSAPRGLVMWSIGGGKGQAWHQDCPADKPKAFNMNRLFYLQDTTVDDGAIVVVPGSHTRGRIPRGGSQSPIEGEVVLTPSSGTLVFLHGHVFHRVTPNVSGKPRVSANFRAYPVGITQEVNQIGVYRDGAYDFTKKKRVDR